MKKFFTTLFFGMFLMGCVTDDPDTGKKIKPGELIILQAYGSSGDAAGASHSFVELYNISDKAISLDGIGLYYADGTSVAQADAPNTATEDGAWKRISLDGKTIPAGGSFLILGPKQSATARYQMPDNSGDINDSKFTLSNRAFKVALIQSDAELTVQNPFTDNGGKWVSGYIDMVGAANDYQGRDLIFGFEEAPARNSASAAVRRTDLDDYNDNSTDFIAARYASTGEGAFTDEELEVRKPRNSSAGAWDPYEEPAEPLPPDNPTVAGPPSALATKLLILQVYGTGTATDGAVSHSFIELYNNTESPVNLSTYSLQYANTTGTDWTVINLTEVIPAKGSYLVRGNNNNTGGRLQLGAADQDVVFYLDNDGFKVALMANQKKLTVINPFAMTGGKAEGYVDMVGAANGNDPDAFEGTLLSGAISKQAAARRGSLTDSDNNNTDFVRIDYRISGINNELLEVRKPRNSSAGAWNPFEEPAEPGDEYEGLPPTQVGAASTQAGKLLILQIGASADDDNNISHSFVELYNAGESAINLSGFTLQYAAGTKVAGEATKDGKWEKIDLTGTIEAGHSFLILGAKRSTSQNPALNIAANYGDMNINTFKLDNRAVKVAIIQSASLLTVQNPFNMDGQGGKAAGYVDMIGVINDDTDQIFGWEGSAADKPAGTGAFRITKQAGVRRTSITDSNVNKNDFSTVTYASISAVVKAIMRPKNHTHGSWNPFAEPVVTEGSSKLMILQANTYGNADGGFESSLVELYNNTDEDIDLGAGNYYLHIGGTGDPGWTTAIKLTDTIPSKCSYLIRSTSDVPAATVSIKFLLPSADQTDTFAIINDNFKVAVITGAEQTTLTVANPFTANAGQPVAGYIDMLGVGNATGFEGTAASTSRPQPPRRTSLDDSDKNNEDFIQYDSRVDRNVTTPGTAGVTEANLYKYWPRNVTAGAWNPITGESPVHPQRK